MLEEKGISPETALVVLLGASEWPEAPDLPGSIAFTNSANKVKDYFLRSFGLPKDNLRDLFDTEKSQEDILRDIGEFIQERTQALELQQKTLKDIIIYFTGHGGFEGTDSDYYLAVRHSSSSILRASAID